jgi:hypothetical protein
VPVQEFIDVLDGYLADIRSGQQSGASTATQVLRSTMRARNMARVLLTGLRGDAGFYSSRALEAWEKNSTSPAALGMHATLKLRECALFKPEAVEIVNLGLEFLKGGAATGTANGWWMESAEARYMWEKPFGESVMMFLFGMASAPAVRDHVSEWLDHMPKSLQYLRPGVLAVYFWERDPADETRWCQEWRGAVAVSHLIRVIEKDKPAAADCGK